MPPQLDPWKQRTSWFVPRSWTVSLLIIAPDWTKPQRREVQEGDVRVLLAKVSNGRNGKEAASIFNQGFWQKTKDGTNPQTNTSPVAKVHFDQN